MSTSYSLRSTLVRGFVWCVGVVASGTTLSAPSGFLKSTLPLNAPPVGLAFDANGVLLALEGAAFGSNEATLREVLPDGTFGESVTVVGDDEDNFFVGSMTYDPIGQRVLISDNTADGRLYAVDSAGVQQTIASGIAGIAGVAVRVTGEIFVSTAPFGSDGAVLQVDRTTGSTTPVLAGLGFGAGLAFDGDDNLIVQDADSMTFLGRLQRLPITEGMSGLEFGLPEPLLSGMQSSAGVSVDSEGDIFTTGSGGLFRVRGAPLAESQFDENGNEFQFATAIAFDPGSRPFESFQGPGGGRLAYMADFGFASQDAFITLLSPARPGDYNTDGDVDAEDYMLWQQTFGLAEGLAADGNIDNAIDAADYIIWRKHAQIGQGNLAARNLAGVPEPATGAGMILIVTLLISSRLFRAVP